MAPGVLQPHWYLASKTPSLGKGHQVVYAAKPKPCCSGAKHPPAAPSHSPEAQGSTYWCAGEPMITLWISTP